MTKNLPAVIPSPELRNEFAAMVDTFRAKSLPHEEDIAKGKNPFKAWREHNLEVKDEIAEVLGLDIYDYLELEDDFHAATSDDILKFCRHFRIHPYELMGDAQDPMTIGLLDAMIAVYDKPSILPLKSLSAKDLARQLITEEASTGYKSLESMRDALFRDYPLKQGLTIEFINAAFEKDGQLIFNEDTLNIEEQAECFWQEADDERHATRLKLNRYENEWNKSGREYHKFGRYLFRDGWPDISKSLRLTFRFAGIDNLAELYTQNPQFIGRDSWPDLAVPLFIDKKGYTWREAQLEHWKHAELMFLAFEEKQRSDKKLDVLEFQCNLFDEWIGAHEKLLWRFENRQKILQHPDFKYLKDTSPKKLLEYRPDN